MAIFKTNNCDYMVKTILDDLLNKRTQIDEMNCEKLVKSVYKLNDLEFETYCTILIHGSSTVSQIKDLLNNKSQYANNNKDRTMISRALKQLYLKELVFRRSETENLSRGYYHVYTAKSLNDISLELNDYIDEWYEKAKLEISVINEQFDNKKKKELASSNV